jgi:hypothetical protein
MKLALLAFTFALPLSQSALAREPLPPGTWNGRGASVVVTQKDTALEFDCAHASIPQPIRFVAKTGAFWEFGKYVPERGGPIPPGEPQAYEALFFGKVIGDRIDLGIEVFDYPAPGSATDVQYDVTRDAPVDLVKCL